MIYQPEWYSLKVKGGKEKQVRDAIELAATKEGVISYIKQIFIPFRKEYRLVRGKKKLQDRNPFPGYIFLYVDIKDGKLQHTISKIPDTMGFITARGWGYNKTPSLIPKKQMDALIQRFDTHVIKDSEDKYFIIGEKVCLQEEPFKDMSGTIQELYEDQKKAKVIVNIFGRSNLMEVNYDQIEKVV